MLQWGIIITFYSEMNMLIKQRWSVLLLLAFFSVPYATHAATLGDLVVSENMTIPAGVYVYDSIVVKTGATLTMQGSTTIDTAFKGVQIHAQNITIEDGASVSATGQGYRSRQGPGAPTNFRWGGSYGGVGGGNISTSTYGSAVQPTHLGSGGGNNSGGGAIELIVSGTLSIEGTLAADGSNTGSGGALLSLQVYCLVLG